MHEGPEEEHRQVRNREMDDSGEMKKNGLDGTIDL